MATKKGFYIPCEACGKIVYKTPSQYAKRKHHYCSNACQAAKKREETFEHRLCEVCGNDMYLSKKSTQRFCSTSCQKIWQKGNTGFDNPRFQGKQVECETCGKEFLIGKYKADLDQHHFCSKGCKVHWYSTVWSQQESWKEESRIRAANLLKKIPATTQTKPQLIINRLLDEMEIKYQNEKTFEYYSIDNYLFVYDLAIEVMGDYWHTSPLRYTEPKNDVQRRIISRDKAKNTYLKRKYNINILYLWESDILSHPDLCRKLIDLYIVNNGDLHNYNSFNYSITGDSIALNDEIIYPYQTKIAC